MGVDLVRGGDQLWLRYAGWANLRQLALAFSWAPAGTVAPDECSDNWNGCYESNCGQLVRKDDAFAMAEAIDRALTFIGNQAFLFEDQRQALKKWWIDDGFPIDPHEPYFLSLPKQFAEFARRGDFVIMRSATSTISQIKWTHLS